MKYKYLWVVLFGLFFSCDRPTYKNPHIAIQTKFGDIEVELYVNQAPKSVAAFLSYVDSGYYKNTSFYRCLNDDNQPTGSGAVALLQGGLWKTNNFPDLKLSGIPHETTQQTKILHTNGTISLARQEPGTATTEFFICIGDQPGYNYGSNNNPDKQGYAAFGKVIKGMNLIRQFYDQPTNGKNGDDLIKQIDILNIVNM